MTPQEELFKQFFNQEKEYIAVTQMGMLDLCAHIEELQKFAFEARAKLAAANEEKREREAKNKKERGILTSVAGDELATDAINRVKARQKRMDKNEKLRENIVNLQMNLGLSRLEAEKVADTLLSAGTIRLQKEEKYKVTAEPVAKPEKPDVPVVNPFAKKPVIEETKTEATEVIIQDDTVIIKTEAVESVESPKPFNPFRK